MTSKVEMLMRDQDVTLFTEKVRSTSILFSLMISRMQVWIICYSISNLESVWISNFLGYTVIIWPINKLYTKVFWLPFIHKQEIHVHVYSSAWLVFEYVSSWTDNAWPCQTLWKKKWLPMRICVVAHDMIPCFPMKLCPVCRSVDNPRLFIRMMNWLI